jgi:hypothetical protein
LLNVGTGEFESAVVDGNGHVLAAPGVEHGCTNFESAGLLYVCTPDGPATQGQSCPAEACAHGLQCVIFGSDAVCEPTCSSATDCTWCDMGAGQCACTVCYDTNNADLACQ